MPTLNHTLHICDSPKVITSTTILRNVVENQLRKARTPHPEISHWAPYSSNDSSTPYSTQKKQEILLPCHSKLGQQCRQGPLAIGLKSEFLSAR